MALSSFTLRALGMDGREYRVDVNGGGDVPNANQQFLVREKGEDSDLGLDPIFPSQLRLFLTDVDLSPLFDLGPRAVPVEAYVLNPERLSFRGFMKTDFYEDAPFISDETVEFRALDGLGTLSDDNLSLHFAEDSEVALTTAIPQILSTLHGSTVDVEFGVHWYPQDGNLSSSDCPLESTYLKTNNYRENRPEGPFIDSLTALRKECISNGLVIRQAERSDGLVWHVRQRDALNQDGTIKTWTYDETGALQSGPDTLDRSHTLDVDPSQVSDANPVQEDHSGGFAPREQIVRLEHNHAPITNLVQNPSFEDGPTNSNDTEITDPDHWAPINDPSDFANGVFLLFNVNGDRLGFSGPNYGPEPIEEDKWALVGQDTADNVDGALIEITYQDLGEIVEAPPRTNLRVKFNSLEAQDLEDDPPRESLTAGFQCGFWMEVGGSWVRPKTVQPRNKYIKGSNEVGVPAVDHPIAAGSQLPVRNKKDDAQRKSTLEVAERVPKGGTTIKGELTSAIDSDDYIYYPATQTSKRYVQRRIFQGTRGWATTDILLPLVDANGTPLKGPAQIGFWMDSEFTVPMAVFDNVQVSLEVAGQPLTKTIYQAKVPPRGEIRSRTIRTSSGPTNQNVSRYVGIDPGGNRFDPNDWALGPSTSPAYSLGKLNARQRLRYWSNNNRRLNFTAEIRDGIPRMIGDELVTVDGNQYTIHSIKADPGNGQVDVTLVRFDDKGTSNITLSTILKEGEGAGGTAGTTTTGSRGSVGSWDEITGKPTNFLARGGDTDGFPSTNALISDDVTGALDLSSSPFLEVDTSPDPNALVARVKDEDDLGSNSDTHLATQQSIKQYVDSGSEVAKDVARAVVQTRAEIGALDAVTVRRSREITLQGTPNRIEVNNAQTTEGALDKDLVLSFTAPQDLHKSADFVANSLNLNEAAGTANAGQVRLGSEGTETYEAVRADRSVTLSGTTNQVAVSGRSGTLTQDVGVTLSAPQDLHPDADFAVDTLRVGTSSTPDSSGGALFSGQLAHPDYTPELEHWTITAAGLGDFRTLLADELVVETFIAEVEQALAGSDFLTKSLGKLDETFTVPGSVGSTATLTVQDLPGLSGTRVFASGDTVRVKYIDRSGGGLTVADVWLKVTGYTDNGDGTQSWTAELLESTAASGQTIGVGAVALDYGDPATGGYLIERSVLDPGDTGDITPYDRILKWSDTTGNRVPDEYEVLNLRGNLGAMPKANAPSESYGVYTELGRFTEDIIVGNLDAATSSTSGSYLKFSQSNGLEIVTAGGNVENRITQNEEDLRLLARRLTQDEEATAGIEFNVNENAATLELSVQFDDNPNNPASEGSFAAVDLLAGPDGSRVTLTGDNIQLDGSTLISDTLTIDAGTAGGWEVEQTRIYDKFSGGPGLELETDASDANNNREVHICVHDDARERFVSMYAQDGGDDFGIVGVDVSGGGSPANNTLFHLGDHNQISSFTFTPERLNDGSTFIGAALQNVDANERVLVGEYNSTPTLKARGPTSGDYTFIRGSNTGVLFEVATGGTPILKVEDSGVGDPAVFIDNLDLKDLFIAGTLTMGSSGQIINQSSPSDFVVDDTGIELTHGDSDANKLLFTESGTKKASIYLFDASVAGTSDSLQFRTFNGAGASFYPDGQALLGSNNSGMKLQPSSNEEIIIGFLSGMAIAPDENGSNAVGPAPVLKFNANKGGLSRNTVFESHPTPPNGEGFIYLFDNGGGGDLELFAATTNTSGAGGTYNRNKIAGG